MTGRLPKRSVRDESGASAIEFAMVAPLLLALLFSLFEAGWLMVERMVIDRSVDQVVRLMRVADEDAPTSAHEVKLAVCERTIVIRSCETSLFVEFIEIDSPADLPTSAAPCVNRGGTVQPVQNFEPGIRNDLVMVRACMVVDPLTPGLGLGLALPKDASGGVKLISSSMFMNEPA